MQLESSPAPFGCGWWITTFAALFIVRVKERQPAKLQGAKMSHGIEV
jgi:hypothetical protein